MQVAEAARLPRISLTAAGGGVDSGLADLVGITNPVAQLGANMFAPLYNGGALQAGVDIADSQQRATMALYAQKALEAFSEVEGALTNEPLLKSREERLQSALEQSEEAYARTRRQYEVGRVELLALLQTQASLISAKSALIAVKNERLAQRVDLHLALGGRLLFLQFLDGRLQLPNDGLRLLARHPALEVGVPGVVGTTPQGGQGDAQEGVALFRRHRPDPVDVAEAGGEKIEVLGFLV